MLPTCCATKIKHLLFLAWHYDNSQNHSIIQEHRVNMDCLMFKAKINFAQVTPLKDTASPKFPLGILTRHCRHPLKGSWLPGWGTETKLSQLSGQHQQKDQSKAAPATTLLKVPFPLQAEEHLTLPYKMVKSGKATGKVWDLLLGPLGDFCTYVQYLGVSHHRPFPYRRTSNENIVCCHCYMPFSYNCH